MHDFEQLVYLDLHKTGSCFVSAFLNETSRLQLRKEIKHGRIGDDYNPEAFYFISIRHPISLYSSLYRYGLDGRGAVYGRIKRRRKAYLYKPDNASFNLWLRFMLNPLNAKFLREDYQKVPKDYELGFMSFRFLMLSLAYPLKTLRLYRNTADPIQSALNGSIINHVIRNETLTEDLKKLAFDIKPELFVQQKVTDFLDNTKKINSSELSQHEFNRVDQDILPVLERRERVLYQYYKSSLCF